MNSLLHNAHVFISVDAFVDGSRVGGNGTCMQVSTEATCKDVLVESLSLRAPEQCPLLDSTTSIMFCVKISDTVQGKPASDVGSCQDCHVFLNYPISMAMSEVPTTRFTFKCSRLVEDRQPGQDPSVAMMARNLPGYKYLPPVRARGTMTVNNIMYKDFTT